MYRGTTKGKNWFFKAWCLPTLGNLIKAENEGSLVLADLIAPLGFICKRLQVATPWQVIIIPNPHVYVFLWNASYSYAILIIMYVEYNNYSDHNNKISTWNFVMKNFHRLPKTKIFYHEQFSFESFQQWIFLE